MVVSINIDILSRTYFYFDEPVNYKINKQFVKIYPISVRESEIFLSSISLFTIDKNATPSVEIIQMSYLQFIIDVLIKQNQDNLQRFVNLLKLCLHMEDPKIQLNEMGKPILIDGKFMCPINGQQFEDIRRIILYQNIVNFDDTYINPEIKQAMYEVDKLKSKNLEVPNLERKMAIITSHTGLSKKEQLEMSYRSHSLLFEEICGEIEFVTIRPIALFGGNGDKLNHWIFKKKKNKMEDYFINVDKYSKSMGQEQSAIKSINSQLSRQYLQQFNNFNN